MEAWKKAQDQKERDQETALPSKNKLDKARLQAEIEESAGSSSVSTA